MAAFPWWCKAAQLEVIPQAAREGSFFTLKFSLDKDVPQEGGKKKFFAQFLGKKYNLTFVDEKTAVVLLAVPVDTTPGKKEVQVFGDEKAPLGQSEVLVTKVDFPAEVLRVPPRKIAPLKKDLPQILGDLKLLKKVYQNSVPEFLLETPIILPVDSTLSSVFGSRRVYNGVKASSHLGTDLRAKIGDPVKAPMPGKVALAKSLFFTGNTVILDHGHEFFTIYAHLSKLRVKVGEHVTQGKELGLAGMTGRASGPHLHWGAQLHGVKIDPMALKEFHWPKPSAQGAGDK